MLEKLRPRDSSTDHLFVGTDRFFYFTVSWDSSSKQLCTEQSYVDQADKSARDSATNDRCLIDPSSQFMALFLQDGIVSVIPLLSKGKRKGGSNCIDGLGDPISTRISAMTLRSCAFLYPRPCDKASIQLALLYEDAHQRMFVSIRQLEYIAGGAGEPGYVSLDDEIGEISDIELGASHVIPVPQPFHGFLVLAETKISYFSSPSDRAGLEQPLDKAAQFVAWTAIDECRYLLADEGGLLHLLMLETEESLVKSWKLDTIGQTSRASVILWLNNGYVFVGSHQGDSQLVSIQFGKVEILQTLSNIAPVLDFAIMDMGRGSSGNHSNEYSSGQARIVTGSGVFSDGSLRSVRSGVGMEEQGVLGEMSNATDIFALRSSANTEHHDVLVVSFVDETRLFLFGLDGEVEEQAEFNSLKLSEPTILCSEVAEHRLIQITPAVIRLIDFESGRVLNEWSDPEGHTLTSASASQREVIVSIGGLEVATFTLGTDILLQARRKFFEGQIACVHVSDLRPGIGFVGFWQNTDIAVVGTEDLQTVKKQAFSEESTSIPRAILLEHLIRPTSEKQATLLISTAGGEVVTFLLNLNNLEFSSRNVTVLGTQQANLKAIPRGETGMSSIFAICEHPSLIYGSDNHIVFSAITAENTIAVCDFNSEFCPGAVAIATPSDIRIALVDTQRTTNVQTLHVGELVRRIAYSSTLKSFGIGTVHRTLEGMEEIITSRFKLADEVLFKELDSFDLNSDELVESVICAELEEDDDEPRETFVVGTSYAEDVGDDAVRGRILILAVTGERKLKLITALPVKGACRVLGTLQGKLLAGLMKTVGSPLHSARDHRG